MESTTNEFVKLFRDRLKYPIITVYGILLIIYNWDVLGVFFLSDKNIEDRIIYINTVFKGQTWSRILWPLCKAILVSILAPAIMWGLEFIQKFINAKRQKIKDERIKATWETKKALAVEEYQYEQAKSGSKTIQEWEAKLNELSENHQAKEIANETVNNLLKEQISHKDSTINEFREKEYIFLNSFKGIEDKFHSGVYENAYEIIDKIHDGLLDADGKLTKSNMDDYIYQALHRVFISDYIFWEISEVNKSDIFGWLLDLFRQHKIVIEQKDNKRLSVLGLMVYQILENEKNIFRTEEESKYKNLVEMIIPKYPFLSRTTLKDLLKRFSRNSYITKVTIKNYFLDQNRWSLSDDEINSLVKTLYNFDIITIQNDVYFLTDFGDDLIKYLD